MPASIRIRWPRLAFVTLAALLLSAPTLFAQGPNPCNWPGFNCQAACSNNPPGQFNGLWPITANADADKITAPFGPRIQGDFDYHEGIDIATRNADGAMSTGLDVHAPWAGWVVSTVNGGACGAGVVLKHTTNANDQVGPNTVLTAYCHLTNTAGSLWAGLDVGDYVARGQFFVDSGDTGPVDPHLHFSTRIGCALERCAVNPLRFYSLQHPHSGHPEVEFNGFYDQGDQKKMRFTVRNRAEPSNGPGCPGGCDENLHFSRVTIKSPTALYSRQYGIAEDLVTIDLDRRINDDSPVLNGGGPGVVGNENGTVETTTSGGGGWDPSETTLTIRPRAFNNRVDEYQVIEFDVTVPQEWQNTIVPWPPGGPYNSCKDYKELIEFTACDTGAGSTDCDLHCRTVPSQNVALPGATFEESLDLRATTACTSPVIMSPNDGSTVPAGRNLRVMAMDPLEEAVVTLEVLKGGAIMATLNPRNGANPFEFDWSVPSSSLIVPYTLRAKAGTRYSDPVVVTADPNMNPEVITFVSPPTPAAGATVPLNSTVTVEVRPSATPSRAFMTINNGAQISLAATGLGTYKGTFVASATTNVIEAVAEMPSAEPIAAERTVYGYQSTAFVNLKFKGYSQNGTTVGENPTLRPGYNIDVDVEAVFNGGSPTLTLSIKKPDGSSLPPKSTAGCSSDSVDEIFGNVTRVCRFVWPAAEQVTGTHTLRVDATMGSLAKSATNTVNLNPTAGSIVTTINGYAFLQKFKNLRAPEGDSITDYPTGINADLNACGVAGISATGGDIMEDDEDTGDPLRAYLCPKQITGQTRREWFLSAEVKTGCSGFGMNCDPQENWNVDVLCLSTAVAQVIPVTQPPTKTFFIKKYKNLDGQVVQTGIALNEYVCGIAGYWGYRGDINEYDTGDIVQMYLYGNSAERWNLKADFRSHNGGEDWEVDVLCASTEIAALGGPAPGKPVFRKTLPPLGDHPNVSTGVSSKDWACSVAGFAARDGDIDEGKPLGRTLIDAYLYDNAGTWYFRGDFRTHHNHEDWTDVSLLCFARNGSVVAPAVAWSGGYGGSAADIGSSVALNGFGELIVAGGFSGSMTLPGGDYPITLTSAGGQDVFLARLKPDQGNGYTSWARRFGGAKGDTVAGLALAPNSDAIGLARWSEDTANSTNATSTRANSAPISWDGVIGKHNNLGQAIWTTRMDGTGMDGPRGITFDAAGALHVTGSFQGTAKFADGTSLVSAGADDIWQAKLDGNTGARLRSARFGASGIDLGTAIAVDAAGNLFTANAISGTVGFGGGNLPYKGGRDLALVRQTSAGVHTWSRAQGGPKNEVPSDLALDAKGDLFVVGYFEGTVDFGAGPLVSAGGTDIFIAKYSAAGAPVWSRRLGGAANDHAQALAVDDFGNVIVTGYFQGQVASGAGLWTSVGDRDVYVASFSGRSGYPVWSRTFGGTAADNGIDVSTRGGAVALTGYFTGQANIGKNLTSAGDTDIFVLKLARQ